MPEPIISPAVATLGVTVGAVSAAVPSLQAFGIVFGLRPDILVAGFSGALAAIALLNSVPSEGDTWRQLIRTTWRRMAVAISSSLVAGYITPVLMPETASLGAVLGVAFATGAGAQKVLRQLIDRTANQSSKAGDDK